VTAQLLLPAIGALYFTLAQIWGLPAAGEVNGTIAVLNTFLGVAVAWLRSLYLASGNQFDGTMVWEDGEEEGDSHLRMSSVDLNALETKGQILLQIKGRPPGR
jgi:hypothetical protein